MKQATYLKYFAVVALTLSVLVSGASCLAGDDPVPRILVTGEGSVELAPDMATLSLTVTREAETATTALQVNS